MREVHRYRHHTGAAWQAAGPVRPSAGGQSVFAAGEEDQDAKFDPVDEPFHDWLRNAASFLDSAVTFEVKPDFGETTGNMWATALTAVSAGLSGTPVAPTRQMMEFKAEFQSISGSFMSFVDEAYSGMYV